MLDIVDAARQFAPALSDRVLIAGHSQGGQAALWAASLAHGYTPDLRVGGTVAFAPAGHLTTILNLIRSVSRPGKAGTIALALRGAQIADPSLDVSSLLTPAARKLWPQTLTTCSAGLNSTSSIGGLSLDQLLNPAANITALDKELAANEPDHPKIPDPVLIEQGLNDTTVYPQLTQQLTRSLAAIGDNITYHTYAGATHASVTRAAADDATAFLKRQLPR